MAFKSIPEVARDAHVLAGRMRRLAIGETVPYSELDGLVSRDLRDRHNRHILDKARRECEADGIVLVPVFGVGMKRVDAADVVAIGTQTVNRVRRLSKRSIRKMTQAIGTTPMDKEATNKVFAHVALLGAISAASQTKKVEAIQAKGNAKDLPLAGVLEVIRATEGLKT